MKTFRTIEMTLFLVICLALVGLIFWASYRSAEIDSNSLDRHYDQERRIEALEHKVDQYHSDD